MHRDRNLGRASRRDSEAGSWAAVPLLRLGPHTWEDGGSGRGAYVPADRAEWKQSGPS